MFVIYFKFQANWFHINKVRVKKRCPKVMKRTIGLITFCVYIPGVNPWHNEKTRHKRHLCSDSRLYSTHGVQCAVCCVRATDHWLELELTAQWSAAHLYNFPSLMTQMEQETLRQVRVWLMGHFPSLADGTFPVSC